MRQIRAKIKAVVIISFLVAAWFPAFTQTAIPKCVTCLQGKPFTDPEVINYMMLSNVTISGSEITPLVINQEVVYVPSWRGENEKIIITLNTSAINDDVNKLVISTISFRAKSPEASKDYFSELMNLYQMGNDLKVNRKFLKSKKRLVEAGREDNTYKILFTTEQNQLISMVWDISKKDQPWVNKITIYPPKVANHCASSCFSTKPIEWKHPIFSVQDPQTHWMALGMNITQKQKEILEAAYRWEWFKNHWILLSPISNTGFYLVPTGNGYKITEVINYSRGESPINSWLGSESKIDLNYLKTNFGLNYKQNPLNYTMYAEDIWSDENNKIKIKVELNSRGEIQQTVFTPVNKQDFDLRNISDKLVDLILEHGCIMGDCKDSVGVFQYSDGYHFIGSFKNGTPIFGKYFNQERQVVDSIDKRPRAVPKPITQQTQKPQNSVDFNILTRAINSINKNLDNTANSWYNVAKHSKAAYLAVGETNKKQYTDEAKAELNNIKNMLKTIKSECSKIRSFYAKVPQCNDCFVQLMNIEGDADLYATKLDNYSAEAFNQSSYEAFKTHLGLFNMYIEGSYISIQKEIKKLREKYNACVEIIENK